MSRPPTARPGPILAAPVVPGSFLLGSALDLRRDMLAACEREFQRYGDAVRFRAGPPGARLDLHMLFHPDAAHRVLAGWSANYRKENVFYSELRSAFGDGLLTTQDDQWQRQKRYLQPLFAPKHVNDYAAAMTGQVQQVVRRWRVRQPGTIDLHAEMTRLTLASQDEYLAKFKAAGVTIVNDVDIPAFQKATASVYTAFPKWTPGLRETVLANLK